MDNPKLFLTRYSNGGHHYGAHLEAENLQHARMVALARGLGERVHFETSSPPETRLAQLIEAGDWVAAAHEACFLGFVGMSAGALNVRELLGDRGLIHELLHLAKPLEHHPDEGADIVAFDKAERLECVEALKLLARDLEWRVPGWSPSYDRPDRDDDETLSPEELERRSP